MVGSTCIAKCPKGNIVAHKTRINAWQEHAARKRHVQDKLESSACQRKHSTRANSMDSYLTDMNIGGRVILLLHSTLGHPANLRVRRRDSVLACMHFPRSIKKVPHTTTKHSFTVGSKSARERALRTARSSDNTNLSISSCTLLCTASLPSPRRFGCCPACLCLPFAQDSRHILCKERWWWCDQRRCSVSEHRERAQCTRAAPRKCDDCLKRCAIQAVRLMWWWLKQGRCSA
jgi:hypothetical protein